MSRSPLSGCDSFSFESRTFLASSLVRDSFQFGVRPTGVERPFHDQGPFFRGGKQGDLGEVPDARLIFSFASFFYRLAKPL